MSSQIRTVLLVMDGSCAHAANSNSSPDASKRRTIFAFPTFSLCLFAPYCVAPFHPGAHAELTRNGAGQKLSAFAWPGLSQVLFSASRLASEPDGRNGMARNRLPVAATMPPYRRSTAGRSKAVALGRRPISFFWFK
ncbi:hypothetical protein [Burkholderia latens]|uniref:hypothetical protein n=1 Tax=Burkholderia latens TaxID=488446 RepID=UPI0014784E4A|nr:hypothetical protein [Burkholderia latens]